MRPKRPKHISVTSADPQFELKMPSFPQVKCSDAFIKYVRKYVRTMSKTGRTVDSTEKFAH